MTNVRISPKGKALLKNRYASSKVVNAIIGAGDKLLSQEGLTVTINGKTVKLKAAAVSNEANISR